MNSLDILNNFQEIQIKWSPLRKRQKVSCSWLEGTPNSECIGKVHSTNLEKEPDYLASVKVMFKGVANIWKAQQRIWMSLGYLFTLSKSLVGMLASLKTLAMFVGGK